MVQCGDWWVLYSKIEISTDKESMGQGTSQSHTPPEKWNYPPPDTGMETILKRVCNFAKNR